MTIGICWKIYGDGSPATTAKSNSCSTIEDKEEYSFDENGNENNNENYEDNENLDRGELE